jgi:hypothetical protein
MTRIFAKILGKLSEIGYSLPTYDPRGYLRDAKQCEGAACTPF